MTIAYKKLDKRALPPYRGTPNSVGWDVHAHLYSDTGRENKSIIPPRSTKLVPTGLVVIAPPGHCILVCSRSGLALKSIFVTNAPGVIDPDYRGELKILLYNGGHESYYVQNEDRIAQLLVTPIQVHDTIEVDEFAPTLRGESGFGSTGR